MHAHIVKIKIIIACTYENYEMNEFHCMTKSHNHIMRINMINEYRIMIIDYFSLLQFDLNLSLLKNDLKLIRLKVCMFNLQIAAWRMLQ